MQLIKIIKSLGNNFIIYDARPYINAVNNKVKGGGFEDVEQYGNDAKLIFCNIENIHKQEKLLKKLKKYAQMKKL